MSHKAKKTIHMNLVDQVRHNAKTRLTDIYKDHGWDIEQVNLSDGTVRIILEEYLMATGTEAPCELDD